MQEESTSWLVGVTVGRVLRWILVLTILGLSYHVVVDPDFFHEWSDPGMWAYFGRMIHRAILDPPEESFSERDFNMLFIGNSYTGYYELHKLTRQCLLAGRTDSPSTSSNNGGTMASPITKDTNVNVEAHFPGGQTLEGHLGGLIRPPFLGKHHIMHKWLIRHASLRHWKWIVLQNHSLQPGYCNSTNPKNKEIFDTSLRAAQQINQIIVDNNPQAQTLFFMTWGRRSHYAGVPDDYPDFLTMQEKTAEGYRQYVAATSTPERPTFLAPVGLVFRTIYNDCQKAAAHDNNQDPPKDPSVDPTSLFFQLLDWEGHHPSLAGSYTAAVTIYATLTGNDATHLQWKPKNLNDQVAAKIRDAVQRTIQETVDQGTVRYPWQDKEPEPAKQPDNDP